MCTYYILKSVMTNRRSYLTYEQRKNRFICYALIYIGIYVALGFIFLTVYLQKYQSQVIILMGICFVYAIIELIVAFTIYQRDDFPWNNDVVIIQNTMGPQYPLGQVYYPRPSPPVPYLADNPYILYPVGAPYAKIKQNYPQTPPRKAATNPMDILANRANNF